MEILPWLNETLSGEFCFTVLVSMIPVVELRGGIPFGVTVGLPVWLAYLAAVIGNMLPVPFLILFVRRLFSWLKAHVPFVRGVVDWLEQRTEKKKEAVLKYQTWGLFLFVAIPLPGTGAWTGAMIAAALDMRLSKAVPAITAGVLAAGFIITCITHSVTAL